jgi:alpha-aminoadipate/glutamate carrier protein LysW
MPACPECDAMIDIEEDLVEEGQSVQCPECGAELEVVNTSPVELDILGRGEDDEDGDVDDAEEL